MFGRDWQPAEATIIEASKALYNLKKNYKVVVEVRPQGEAPFRTELGIPGRETHFKFPTTGPVGVLFDPTSRKVKWDRDDPRVYSDQDRAKEQADLDAALRAPAGSQPVVEPQDDAAQSNADEHESIAQARQMWRENLEMRDLDGD